MIDGLIEPVNRSDWDVNDEFGRAVLSGADRPDPTEIRPPATARLDLRWGEDTLRVPPLDLQRAVCRRRGFDERVAMIDTLA